MSIFVVDASVALKWFLPESGAETALRLRAPAHELCAPDFLWLEVSSAVCQEIKRNRIPREEGLQILPALRQFAIRIFASADLLDSATAVALETGTSIYDCIYLALALSLDAKLVTADRRFYLALGPSQFAGHVLWFGEIL